MTTVPLSITLHDDMTVTIEIREVPIDEIDDLFRSMGTEEFTQSLCDQMDAKKAARKAQDDDLFSPMITPSGRKSQKVECRVCGRNGFPDTPWQRTCRRGHSPCPDCGRQFSLLSNGKPRIHARCPARKEERFHANGSASTVGC